MFNNDRLNIKHIPSEFVGTSTETTYMKEGMCILINEFWKDSGAGSTGCTPVYSSGKTASGDKLEDLDAETPYNLFDYYAVSNGDAFND